MKRVGIFITIILLILICSCVKANAKDTLYSINKYKEAKFDFITSSYNEKGKIDGKVVAGSFLDNSKNSKENESKKSEDYQITLVKYNKEGKEIWNFSYGKNSFDTIDYLTYTYAENGQIDGYLVAMKATKEMTENLDSNTSEDDKGIFLKIDLKGKLVWEKDTKISNYISINKIIPTYNESQTFDGYVAIATYKNSDSLKNASIIRYDKDYNVIWEKQRPAAKDKEVYYTDLINIYEDEKVSGFAVIETEADKENKSTKIIKFTKEGDSQILKDSLEKYESSSLKETANGYIQYGLTKEVKLENGESSCYLINYDSSGNELWETIGDIPTSTEGPIKLLSSSKDEKVVEYLLLYKNSVDDSFEVIKFDSNGTFQSKVKKISNEYYNIVDFQLTKDVLYFIGYISCPEDDSCSYNTDSLFLVSTEDKVIEVKDNDSGRILLTSTAIIFLAGTLFVLKRRKKLQ